MKTPTYFINKADVNDPGDDYYLYISWAYNENKYVIKKVSVSGTVTTTQYYTGSGSSISDDWTNRAGLTYTDHLPIKEAVLTD